MAPHDRSPLEPDDADDGWDDRDDPLEADQDDDWHADEALATDRCAACGREIIADVVQCPYCGEYAPVPVRSRPTAWVRNTALAVVGGFVIWIVWIMLR
jgi:DNA-directed RNA polymerase subunit RPC12/RpoP